LHHTHTEFKMVAITAIAAVVVISMAAVGVLSLDMFLLNKERKNIGTEEEREEFDRRVMFRANPRTPMFFAPY